MVLKYLAVIVSVPISSASYLNAKTKFIIRYHLRDYKEQCGYLLTKTGNYGISQMHELSTFAAKYSG